MDGIFNVLCSMLDAALALFFLAGFFEKEKIGRLEAVSFLVILIMGMLANSDVARNMFWTLAVTIYLILYGLIVCGNRKLKAVIAGVMFSLFQGIITFGVMFFTAILTQNDLEETRNLLAGIKGIFPVLIIKIVLFFLVLIFLRCTKKRTLIYLKRSEWMVIGLLMVIVLLIQIILFYTVFMLDVHDKIIRIYGLCAVFLLLFAGGIVGIIVRLNRVNGERLEYQKMMVLYEVR